MKIIIIAVISLLLGVGVGWCLGYTQAAKKAGSLFEYGREIGEELGATYAAEAVRCIDEGDTQRAVHSLSVPIAHYWVSYAITAGTNSERLRTRSYIEERAYTNSIVAAQIKRQMSWGPDGK